MAAASDNRSPRRGLAQIKADIEENGRVTRQDVSEMLLHTPGKQGREKRREHGRAFLNDLPNSIANEKRGGRTVKDKILDDLDSYPI